MQSIRHLTDRNRDKLQAWEERLGYRFADADLLQLALVHSSFGFERIDDGRNNETLEFIGDAVLDLAVSDMLFHVYPGLREGELTKMRARLVRESTLAGLAQGIDLGRYIMLGKGEEASLGREKASILASAFEALLGAIYLDRGFASSLDFISDLFRPLLPEKKAAMLAGDAKSLLQEKLQEQFNVAPTYHLEGEDGPDHAKKFTISVKFREKVLGIGTGSSKKAAEKQAAEEALASIGSWWRELGGQ